MEIKSKTTRELLLDRILSIQEEIELLKKIIDKEESSKDENFLEFHFCELEMKNRSMTFLRDTLITGELIEL